uniref:Uncharacterized protein n=1 Tax=Podoviridae sp. ctlpi2 TaxID=2826574 RepID=A0A8S5MLL0_9CAUD|nr:MAG TPA: Protein of unknown function (DUF2570) [Podoviridae sp. ctlpi2]
MGNWKYYLIAAAVLAVAKISWEAGETHAREQMQHEVDKAQQALADIQREAQRQADDYAAILAEISASFEKEKQEIAKKRKVQRVEVQKIIKEPVYRSVCLPADGLREVQRAIQEGATAAQSDRAVR